MWHAIQDWVRSGNWAPTFQGVATLVGAFVALVAVMWQVRSSSKHLRDQIAAQRVAEEDERERQRRAIATAILFEIDSFCLFELDLDVRYLARWDPDSNSLPSPAGLRTNVTEIYKGISPLFGSLNAVSVSAIVKFYSMVGMYEGLWHRYQYSLDMLRNPTNSAVEIDPESLLNDVRAQLKTIRDLIPEIRKLAENVTNSVARECGVEELLSKGDAKKN